MSELRPDTRPSVREQVDQLTHTPAENVTWEDARNAVIDLCSQADSIASDFELFKTRVTSEFDGFSGKMSDLKTDLNAAKKVFDIR